MAAFTIPGLLCLMFFAVCHSLDLPLNTKKGPIVGIRVTTGPITPYDAFIGIPYGGKPTRFQLAQPRNSWTSPLYTQTDGPACPQPDRKFSEDCLYLNVYTPVDASKSTSILPVMAFIHGSAFTVSSSSSKVYGPDFLIPSGVILVTMNYRLGAAGFLTLGSKVAPGNLGLFDTLLALQWIQDEISVFGGDPKSVTVFGQSAGSAMTQYHYISPVSQELFTKAIAHSGSALAGFSHVSPTEGARRAKLLAQALHCDTAQNDSVILDCLQKADINDVVANQSIPLSVEYTIPGNGLPFVPVLDTYITADKPFFNSSLTDLMKAALDRKKPLMTGFTTDEGIFRFADDGWKVTENYLDTYISQRVSDDKKKLLLNSIKSRYFLQTPDDNKVEDVVRLYTDSMFAYPSVQVSRYFANLTYGYLFAYNGGWVIPPAYFSQYKLSGVSHGDDLTYLFYGKGSQYLDNCHLNKPNVDMMMRMVNWWTNFAKSGTPDSSWKTISPSGGYLVINSVLSTMNISSFEQRYYNFWADLDSTQSSGSITNVTNILLFIMLLSFYLFK